MPLWGTNQITSIERIPPPDPVVFRRKYVNRSIPVIITGGTEDWPARKMWSPGYLSAAFGDREIPVASVYGGKVEKDPKTGIALQSSKMRDFLASQGTAEGASRYAMFPVQQYLPELENDLRVPAFAPPSPWSIWRFWMSPADTHTPLHMDLPDNLFAQIVGRKRIALFRPSWGGEMYRYPLWSHLPQISQVDADNPDYDRFPKFRKVVPIVCTVEAGEMLYIPRLWWHHVRSLSFSISVNHWWGTGPLAAVIYGALAYQKLRAIRF